ncbi:MAG: TetR/AcrR family transcriptional regulator [Niabella sp.]
MTKKEYILKKAEELFSEKGFDATSVRDISKRAKINIAMISYYFGSKEKLMEELFKMRMDVGFANVKDIADATSLTLIEKVNKALDGYVDRVKQNAHFYRVVLAEQTTNKNKTIIKSLKQSKLTFAKFFEEILHEGKTSGDFKNTVDPVMYLSTITGFLMQALLNAHFYADYHEVGYSDDWVNQEYFEKVKEHLKSISKNILGYEVKS